MIRTELKEFEDMKRKLKLRLEMASFLQEMVGTMEAKAKEKARLKAEKDKQKMMDDIAHPTLQFFSYSILERKRRKTSFHIYFSFLL